VRNDPPSPPVAVAGGRQPPILPFIGPAEIVYPPAAPSTVAKPRRGEKCGLALRVALSVAQADGFVDENETRVLRSLAELLGLDPNKIYEEINTGTVGNGIGEPWW